MVLLVRAPPRPKGDLPEATIFHLPLLKAPENVDTTNLIRISLVGHIPAPTITLLPCQVVVVGNRIADDCPFDFVSKLSPTIANGTSPGNFSAGGGSTQVAGRLLVNGVSDRHAH